MDHGTFEMILAGAIFVGAYSLIMQDKLDRMVVSLGGAVLMILFRIVTQETAFEHIDYNTLGLLISMMVIVTIMQRTGAFEFVAIRTAKIAKGNPVYIMLMLTLITGVISAFLDNVTTILLILPVTLAIAKDLEINPVPLIISEVFGSNVGGTATLIGDPPNIMIGSAANLSFMTFVENLGVICFVMLLCTSYIFVVIYRKQLKTTDEAMKRVMQMDEYGELKDTDLLQKCLWILAITVVGFVLHGTLHFESATIAIFGATALLLFSGVSVESVMSEVEWKTIFFFAGLFVMVGGLQEVGIVKLMAQKALDITHGDLRMTTLAILWVSAIASAFIDNIPFVATMIPMIKDLGALSGMNVGPLWWALSLGACLGGNGTAIGASANVVATGIAEEHGHKITFRYYLKIAFPVMLLTVLMSTVYLWFVFLQ